MPQYQPRKSGDYDPSSHSSDEPSFYSDPFKHYPVKPSHGRASTPIKPSNTRKVQELTPSRAPQPYPVSIRAYNRRDYEYIASFPRSLQAGLRAGGSEAEILQQKMYNTNIESDFLATSSLDLRVSRGSTGSGSSTDTSGKHGEDVIQTGKHQQQHQSTEIRTDTHDHPDRAQLAGEPIEPNNGVKEEEKRVPERQEYTAAESSLAHKMCAEAPGNRGRASGCGKPVEMKQLASFPEFGAWNRESPSPAEAYTDIFNQIREKRAGGSPAQALPLHLKTPIRELSVAKIPPHAGAHHRKWSSSSWILCFVAPGTID